MGNVPFALTTGCASTRSSALRAIMWKTLDSAPPLIIAHRGASGYLPEHTLEAYSLAIDQGADIIELDLVFTKDGVLVARHDRYLSTTTNVADEPSFTHRRRANPDPEGDNRNDWWVEDFTLTELKSLRARQPNHNRPKEFDDRFEIPTLDEVLALLQARSSDMDRNVGVYSETKHPNYFESINLDFETPLLVAFEGFDGGPVLIQSFEPYVLRRLKGKTTAKLVLLHTNQEQAELLRDRTLREIAAYADGIGPEKSIVFSKWEDHSRFVEKAHQHGLFVHPWTFRNDSPNELLKDFLAQHHPFPDDTKLTNPDNPLSSAHEYEFFFAAGVDGVFTDFPDTAIAVRNELAR